ncbi:glucose oxidase [Vararia minispora EC-137]|uniref:Glucose oxidase n=1 Tax=Vararia minispora EC-137 TaxID=1314806 RepID=A0ACB8QPY3_9AGAM|nr:glucose oxidase [Vararia minispora EC-137]
MHPSLHLLVLATCVTLASTTVISDPSSVANATFDYIIVGGGTAGLTIASRLSEDAGVRVLVIEAGPDNRTDPLVTDVTQFTVATGSTLDWAYKTVDGRTISGGKTLGGSSSINGATWMRGMKAQYDAFTLLLDPEDANKGWNWDGLFPYMKKAEDFTPPNATQRAAGADDVAAYHGFGGPVKTGFPLGMFLGPSQPYFVETAQNMTGLKLLPDLNGGDADCISFIPNSLNPHKSDTRSSSASSYLTPVENSRPNWTTLLSHQVSRVFFANSSLPLTATAVEFVPTPANASTIPTSALPTYTAHAAREIILSSGAIRTPALLQLSGIGDASHLSALGITPLVDLPTVGKNFQEQTNSPLGAAGDGFDARGRGPNDVIAFPSVYELFGDMAGAAVENITKGIEGWAESQAHNAANAQALKRIFEVQAGTIINDSSPIVELFYATNAAPGFELAIAMWNLLPFSRGNVSIQSTDPLAPPAIDVGWFSVPFDMRVQVAGARLARNILSSPPTSTLSLGETVPGFATVPANATDAEWATWLLGAFGANSHPLGTAALMSRSLGGVVDASLTVYDTKNLRVVDASVLPIQISAHLSSTVYGVAEKAADIVKAAWAGT